MKLGAFVLSPCLFSWVNLRLFGNAVFQKRKFPKLENTVWAYYLSLAKLCTHPRRPCSLFFPTSATADSRELWSWVSSIALELVSACDLLDSILHHSPVKHLDLLTLRCPVANASCHQTLETESKWVPHHSSGKARDGLQYWEPTKVRGQKVGITQRYNSRSLSWFCTT